MAETVQGVSYEFKAEDKTGQATESALENVKRLEKAAEEASRKEAAAKEKAKKDSEDVKSFFAAATKALSGDFKDLAVQFASIGAKLRGLEVGAKAMGAIGFAAAGVISAVKGLAEAFRTASAEEREIAKAEVESGIRAAGEGAKDFADEMARARAESERLRKIFDDELQSMREMAKAQNELAKQRELAMARTPEERASIERRHARRDAANDASLDERSRRREIEDARAEIGRLEKELASAESDAKRYNDAGRGSTERILEAQNRGFFGTLWGKFTDRLGLTDNEGDEAYYANASENTSKLAGEAAAKVEEIQGRLEEARHRLEMANRREEIALVQDAAADQRDLNEDFQREDEAAAREQEMAEEERVKRIEKIEAESEERIQAKKMRDISDAADAQRKAEAEAAAARDRLSAARAAVQQAWGWYRDKDSMKAQIDEEKANADAERQFEKDFAKLSFRRDWRTAKNLSVDQEAVRRVGLAREEEAAAKKAAAETAENTARAAASLETIEKAFAEGGV